MEEELDAGTFRNLEQLNLLTVTMSSETSLEKGLAILEAMNHLGPLRVREIHARTGYPKPTIVRMLKVLESRGYVTRLERNAGYCLSSRVLALSDGYNAVARLVEAAAPRLDSLTERVLWPAALAVLDFEHMVVRYSTISRSPLSHTHSTMSRRLSILHRAHGRAYLAFCPDDEREQLLSRLDKDGRMFIEPYMDIYRRQGWAERDLTTDPQTNTIAVPVLHPTGRVAATIGCTFFRSTLHENGKCRLADELKETAQEILEWLQATPSSISVSERAVMEGERSGSNKRSRPIV
ncbi:helix-turn-helix domain-containing protein [Chelativorans sp. AA-79]|uniref:helix-turn-helix domain-containing protein n=1 Tax=Chelativorans sp. AA-79 TaxID=3028735 RepID=UPI0023F71015|nr:helix-turn-helix domain-containing protein [Chelativorans sp. AA-79]WEX07983.1 helix-turn-helix domain-containing protein [Chelativorans sp. AA-79]